MGTEITVEIPRLVLLVSLILLAARISGEITERFFKAPGVLGELVAGMAIGPYALGGIELPYLGTVFPLYHQVHGPVHLPIPAEIYFLAQVAAIILLFLSGLETDLKQFVKYVYPSLAVAFGGVALPFGLGVWACVHFGYGASFFGPTPLFVGAVMTATSVGITARILNKVKKNNSPEGVTILESAVIDDILGILILSAVLTMTTLGDPSLGKVAMVGSKTLIFLVLLLLAGYIISRFIDALIKQFQSPGADLVIPLGFCLMAAALAERFGLAMIIGAYLMGLALSITRISTHLKKQILPLYQVLVPVFFVVMGMLVDFRSIRTSIGFAVVISLFAIFGKVVGAGLPSLLFGFNRLGALRIGLGMLPRGEVALIIAGVGISAGAISQDIYGVVVMMTLVTTLLAPIFFLRSIQRAGSGMSAAVLDRARYTTNILEDPKRYSFHFEKEWDLRVEEEWRNHLIKVLSENGFKRIRSIHGLHSHLFTYRREQEGELFSISEAFNPNTSRVLTRINATHVSAEEYIREADLLYNDAHRISYIKENS